MATPSAPGTVLGTKKESLNTRFENERKEEGKDEPGGGRGTRHWSEGRKNGKMESLWLRILVCR